MQSASDVTSRYALYFCPEASAPVSQLGSQWLGRDLNTGCDLTIDQKPALPSDISFEEWSKVTASARRYGFHATLKPPFRMALGRQLKDLQKALHQFAATTSSFELPPFVLSQLGHFLALVLSEKSLALNQLADDCVRNFDSFRAPATESEIAARKNSSHSVREQEHLLTWGYPYVFDTWKFHMTLTCSLHPDRANVFSRHLQTLFAEACAQPLLASSICLLEESAPGQPFQLIERVELAR